MRSSGQHAAASKSDDEIKSRQRIIKTVRLDWHADGFSLPLGCVLALASKYLGSVAAQRLALILLPYVCPLLRQTQHMVVPLNGAECVAVVQTETHMIFCTISKQLLAGAPTCKQARAC